MCTRVGVTIDSAEPTILPGSRRAYVYCLAARQQAGQPPSLQPARTIPVCPVELANGAGREHRSTLDQHRQPKTRLFNHPNQRLELFTAINLVTQLLTQYLNA